MKHYEYNTEIQGEESGVKPSEIFEGKNSSLRKTFDKATSSGWSYRVIKMPDQKIKGLHQTYSWGIHEVWYTNDVPTSWTAEPVFPIGDTLDDLKDSYRRFAEAFWYVPLTIKRGKLVKI